MSITKDQLTYLQSVKMCVDNEYVMGHYTAHHKDNPQEAYEIVESFPHTPALANLATWIAGITQLIGSVSILPSIAFHPNQQNIMIFKHESGHSLKHYLQGDPSNKPSEFDLLRIFHILSKSLAIMHQRGIGHNYLSEDTIFLVPEYQSYSLKIPNQAQSSLVAERKTQSKILMPKIRVLAPYTEVLQKKIIRDITALKSLIYVSFVGQKPVTQAHTPDHEARQKAWYYYRNTKSPLLYGFLKTLISQQHQTMDEVNDLIFSVFNQMFKENTAQLELEMKKRIEYRNSFVKYKKMKQALFTLYTNIDKYMTQQNERINLCEEQMIHLFDITHDLHLIKKEIDKMSNDQLNPMQINASYLEDLDKLVNNSKFVLGRLQSQPPKNQSLNSDFVGVKLNGLIDHWKEDEASQKNDLFDGLVISHPNLKELEEQMLSLDSQIKISDLSEILKQNTAIPVQNSLTPLPYLPAEQKKRNSIPIKQNVTPTPSWVAYGKNSSHSSQNPPVSNIDITSMPPANYTHEEKPMDIVEESVGPPTQELATMFASEIMPNLSQPTSMYEGINVHQPLPEHSRFHTYEKPIVQSGHGSMIMIAGMMILVFLFRTEIYELASIIGSFYKEILQHKVDK